MDKPYYILLDEIQEVEGFESVLNSLLRIPNADCYVTGSNSKFLSSDIITEFRGRGDELRIHPLSYREFYDAWEGDKNNAYAEYSLYGGLPALIGMQSHEQKTAYLQNIFENVYIRDILGRNDLRKNDVVVGDLLNILASSVGSLTNPTKLANTFNSLIHASINRITVSHYLDCFVDAFLVHKVLQYNIQGKSYIGSHFKYYFEDIGLRNARINFRQIEPTRAMENILYNELISRGYSVDVGTVTANYKDEFNKSQRKQLEIDFVCTSGNKKCYIQSAYAIETKEKEEQESLGFLKIQDSFKKIIIQKDCYVPWYDENGIYHIGLEDFLLNKNSLNG